MKQLLKEFGLGLKKLLEQHKNEDRTSDSQLRNHRKTPSLYEGESYEKIAHIAKSNLIYKLKSTQEQAMKQEERSFFGDASAEPLSTHESTASPKQKRLLNP